MGPLTTSFGHLAGPPNPRSLALHNKGKRSIRLHSPVHSSLLPSPPPKPQAVTFVTGCSHRTHQGASSPIPGEVCRRPGHRTLASDSLGSIRSHTHGGCRFTLTPDNATGPTEGASDALSERVQLVVNVSPDARCSVSGATLSASGAPVFSVKWLAGP